MKPIWIYPLDYLKSPEVTAKASSQHWNGIGGWVLKGVFAVQRCCLRSLQIGLGASRGSIYPCPSLDLPLQSPETLSFQWQFSSMLPHLPFLHQGHLPRPIPRSPIFSSSSSSSSSSFKFSFCLVMQKRLEIRIGTSWDQGQSITVRNQNHSQNVLLNFSPCLKFRSST